MLPYCHLANRQQHSNCDSTAFSPLCSSQKTSPRLIVNMKAHRSRFKRHLPIAPLINILCINKLAPALSIYHLSAEDSLLLHFSWVLQSFSYGSLGIWILYTVLISLRKTGCSLVQTQAILTSYLYLFNFLLHLFDFIS